MAARKTLSTDTLRALGAAHLAVLLMDLAEGDAALKRRLRMEIAGPEQAVAEVRKRLASLKRAKSYIEWNKAKALLQDLETQLGAITEKVAPDAPAEALDLLWRFLALAGPLYNRCDDSSGSLGDVFSSALTALPMVAKLANTDPETLAEQMFAALQENDYGQYDGLIPELADALGTKGMAHLKKLVEDLGQTPISVPPEGKRKVVGWGSHGETYAHELEASRRKSMVETALKDIADAQGDVDGFIALYDAKTQEAPGVAAGIAARLLAAGRAKDALRALDKARRDPQRWPAWLSTRLEVLEALGQGEAAQAQRWQQFESRLSAPDLRDYLKRLPDFDDIEAEDKALDFALAFEPPEMALHFLCHWPALDHAAKLVLQRGDTLNGNDYETLTALADALSARHPLAATFALRAMITFALERARTKRYRHAARHLLECESLAAQIEDFSGHADHVAFLGSLKQNHGRKASFWARIEG